MYVLAKFQLCILKAFKLQPYKVAETERLICTVSIEKNKLQVFPKTYVTYGWNGLQTRILHDCVCHELKNGFLGKLFLLLSFITTNKVEIHEKTLIANNCFDVT